MQTTPTILIIGLTLSACATGPQQPISANYQRPAVALPDTWQTNSVEPQASPELTAWWTRFKSVELEHLMEAAIANNYNLKAAASRIAQARAIARIAGVPLLPEAGVSGDLARGRGAGDAVPSTKASLELGASFELDLWGKNRQAHEAALNRVQASVFAQRLVKVTLHSDVALAYFQMLSAGDRLELARKSLMNAEALLELLQVQFKAGAISGLEVERQQGLIVSVRAGIPPLELERQSASDALAILLGRTPQGFTPPRGTLAAIDLPAIAPDLPSKLLERRSDIRQAEANLVAANADISAARAAFFPSIRLTAATGFASKELISTLSGFNFIYNLAAGITAPIFNRGRLQGNLELAQARQDELIQNYQQSILVALREVEGSLASVKRFAEQDIQQRQLIQYSKTALDLIELRYRNGAIDFTTVLDAQRVLLAAQTAQEQLSLSRYAAAVGLYRALGGGWEDIATALPSAARQAPSPRKPAQAQLRRTTSSVAKPIL
jgi:outer membrane protein, multidrug efflux system